MPPRRIAFFLRAHISHDKINQQNKVVSNLPQIFVWLVEMAKSFIKTKKCNGFNGNAMLWWHRCLFYCWNKRPNDNVCRVSTNTAIAM